MDKLLKDVLIKEVRGIDYVFVVNNLPKELLYRNTEKMVLVPTHAVDFDRLEPKLVKAYVLRNEDAPDEPRNRKITHEMTDELLPGIELSQTGDGGYVIHMDHNDGIERMKAIDGYIRSKVGPMGHIPNRVPYAAQVGSFTSHPKPISQIPRVELPGEPVSPPTDGAQAPSDVQDNNGNSTPILVAARKPGRPRKE